MKPFRILLFLALLASAAATAATIDVIQLRHRSADELLPLLTPHLSSAASITGAADRVIVRAEPTEITQLRRLVAELDQPRRNISLRVRRGSGASGTADGYSVGGNSRSGGRVRVYSSESVHAETGEQQIRGLEGRPLQITTRSLLPITEHIVWLGRHSAGAVEQTRLLELDGGLYALAHLHDDAVEVDILVQDRSQRDPLASRQVVSTVSGRVGEWIPFATTDANSRTSERGLIYRSEDARRQAGTLWLRVDVLD
ncbi:MAG TPA: secretin N-terminal domain-containing protein [Gammaproteobacteria bacterium]|nr:secretin N-terminal domain-containing protein [Gammaproteobacteria bacterium]